MYSTDGIVLKKTDSGEADALFTVYTKDFGKIRARAQGIKKEGAKLKGHLELLNLSSISFVLGKNGERLTHATLVNYWPLIRNDLERLKLAQKIAEIVDKNCFPGQKDESLWDFLLRSFDELSVSPEIDNFSADFRKEFFSVLGYNGEDV